MLWFPALALPKYFHARRGRRHGGTAWRPAHVTSIKERAFSASVSALSCTTPVVRPRLSCASFSVIHPRLELANKLTVQGIVEGVVDSQQGRLRQDPVHIVHVRRQQQRLIPVQLFFHRTTPHFYERSSDGAVNAAVCVFLLESVSTVLSSGRHGRRGFVMVSLCALHEKAAVWPDNGTYASIPEEKHVYPEKRTQPHPPLRTRAHSAPQTGVSLFLWLFGDMGKHVSSLRLNIV